jgi:hypothetical protein
VIEEIRKNMVRLIAVAGDFFPFRFIYPFCFWRRGLLLGCEDHGGKPEGRWSLPGSWEIIAGVMEPRKWCVGGGEKIAGWVQGLRQFPFPRSVMDRRMVLMLLGRR